MRRLSVAGLSQHKKELDWSDIIPPEFEKKIEEEEEVAKKAIPSKYDVDDLDVVSMIESSYDEDTETVKDLKIDDRDLPRAKNYFDFCTRFLGKNTKIPFARQMYIGYHLFGEYCPRCSNPKWEDILEVPVDYPTKDMQAEVQFLEYGKCPKCKATRSEMFKSGELCLYDELSACVGQRGGKSVWTASGSTYLQHCYLKLPKISTICSGIQDFSPITATFVAVRFADAYALLWKPILNMIDDSPWFTEYHKLLTHSGNKYGREILKKKEVFITYGHKNLELLPAGPNKRGLRGRTRFISAIDELGWFPVRVQTGKGLDDEPSDAGDRERADAEEVYVALSNSMATVNTEVRKLIHTKNYNTLLPAYMICVSSPSSRQDKIWRLTMANKDSKTALAIHLPTWEMNPNMPRDCDFIQKKYAANPVKAERDFGANPPKSMAAFIEDTVTIQQCFAGKNRAEWKYEESIVNGKMYVAGRIVRIIEPVEKPPAIMAIDAGYSGNSFALIVAHKEQLVVRTDALIEIQPGEGKVLHYNAIYKGIIAPLIRALNVRFLFADRWQSIALLHRAMEEYKVEAAMYSVKHNDFNLSKSKLEAVEIILPKMERVFTDDESINGYPQNFKEFTPEHLFHQMQTVIEVGKTVTKGPGYTDDLFRALVLLISRMYDPKISEKLAEMTIVKRESRVMGAVGSYSNSIPRLLTKQKIASYGRRH